jgi:glycerophosphoryl diester phosphodiesterase
MIPAHVNALKPLLGAVLAGTLLQMNAQPGPLIIAHLAIEMGADVIEPDLVSTKDGVLVARHENEIGGTTDAPSKFPGRKTTKTIDNQQVTGWFVEDFTWAEIQTLRAVERLAFRSHDYDGRFSIPRFEDVVSLAADRSRALGREIAVYPETKHPTYFRGIGLAIEERLLAVAAAHGWTSKTSPIFIQSFEPSSLQRLRPLTSLRLVQLLNAGADASPERLAAIARYADGVGPEKRLIVPVQPGGSLGTPTNLVRDAHAAGLFVHVWTLRREPQFLPGAYAGDLAREFRQFADLGVDGIFTDFPDVGVEALKRR